MIRKSKGISRSLAAIAVLAAVVGCDTKSTGNPNQQLQSPTQPLAGLSITIGATRTRLQVGDDQTVSVISVQVLRTADWTPVPNGTDAAFTATLGAIDSPSGARAVTVDLVSGKGSITLYPGTTEGTARIKVTVLGVSANLNVTIDPDPTGGVPPEPAPVQSTLNLICSPGALGEDDPSDPVTTTCQVTVLGDDGNPFKGAGVYLTSNSGLGSFGTSGSSVGDIQKTDGAGQVSDILSIVKQALIDFPGTSFQITAHLGVEGGERTTTFTVTIIAGAAPPEAASVVLTATSSTTIEEDDGTQTVDLDARVRDQFGDDLDGAMVDFSFGATGGPGTISPASEETGAGGTNSDPTGHATATFSASEFEVENFPFDQFTIVAKVVKPSGTVSSAPLTIFIARTPTPTLIADFSYVATATNDVDFTDGSVGGATQWRWDFDNDGGVDSTVQNPTDVDFTPFGGAGVYQTKLVIIRDGDGATDTVIKTVTVP